jgi:hypothetical protein
MKKRYEDGGEIDALEEADKAYRANKPPLKEMGDASSAEEAGQFGEPGTSRVVKASPKAAPKSASKSDSKAKPKLIDPSNIRSGVRFDDEGLIDPSNIRSGRREFEESQRTAKASDSGRDMRTPRYTPPGSAPKQTTQKPKAKVYFPDRPDNSFPGSKFSKGGSVSSASKRADGIATKGKTNCKMR